MEEREETSVSGILKTSKKGAKKSKALSAEEEARRREAVKEALLEKVELEKRALQIVERLLEDSVTEDFLIDCAWFITPANYKDTIEERSIAKLCGYPICPNKLGKIPTQQYKICTRTCKVYDITERKFYCSNFCYKASKQFEVQISKTPLWLRKHESPSKITLLKKGDNGSSGEEVKLSERHLQEEDIENPLPTQIDPHKSSLQPEELNHSYDSEHEQDFVSSVVFKKTGPKVHWGDLPKCNDRNTQSAVACDEKLKENDKQEVNGNTVSLDEATTRLHLCSLSENNAESNINSKTENSNFDRKQEELPPDEIENTSLIITQVGMSKKGAEGLRNLLKQHKSKPDSIQQNLLEYLKKTLNEWGTDETLVFLYGSERSAGMSFSEVMEGEKEEEVLDEDDIDDEEEVNRGGVTKVTPDYEPLKREMELMKLKVKEFYKGSWEIEEDKQGNLESTEPAKEPILPLVDSKAQHILQKKITVDKLRASLKNIVGPLGLTMSDISTDLNNLVRTFRFTNTNIIHKSPEWCLIAVVLLYLLSEVSPVIRGALEQPSSVQYLSTLMEELGLREEDLLSVVLLFKPHIQLGHGSQS
ncbi:putative RNA polymerase II subunit B1 CTD phosphatase rpap2 [Periophthalmus magnuspinnatus]|uniref:putative RNA polymerase II subunit B1 CTD phosphatase rpap2 n=1 Tax=Periophthalmus magnuspinnatus TaxID=409849 RepID=UPI00145B4F4B|nr:putative RNA polymerase II subunit B1 CTD phosphatase rpap2 [Periophthalmus magnuspinnatus]